VQELAQAMKMSMEKGKARAARCSMLKDHHDVFADIEDLLRKYEL